MSEVPPDQVARWLTDFDDSALYGICPVIQAPDDDELVILDDRTFRPLTKEDVAPLHVDTAQPLDLRFVNALEDLWKQADALDALKTMASVDTAMKATMLRVTEDEVAREEFLSIAAEAYASYVREGAKGTLEMFLTAFRLLFELAGWQDLGQRLTVEAIVAAVDPSQEVDFGELLAKAEQEKPELLTIITVLSECAEMFKYIAANQPIVFAAALELMAEVTVTLMELLRDAKIRDLLIKSALDHKLIARLTGTIIGFVVWDIVIDELTSLGFGKATRFVRHVVW